MKSRSIAQVTDSIPGKVFRAKATDSLVTRFNDIAKITNPEARVVELQKIRDDSYKIAHDVWIWNMFYNHSKKFQSAYALFHAAKKMVDVLPSDANPVRQSLSISLYNRWKYYINANVDYVRSRGGDIDVPQVVKGFLKSSFTITGDRKSLEALRDELSVLRLGHLTNHAPKCYR